MEGWQHEILVFLNKIWLSVVGIGVGIIGKFSYDMVNGKKYSKAAFWGALGVCIFVGYIVSTICRNVGWVEKSAWLTPIATALSQTLMQALIQNWHKVFKKITGGVDVFDKEDEKE